MDPRSSATSGSEPQAATPAPGGLATAPGGLRNAQASVLDYRVAPRRHLCFEDGSRLIEIGGRLFTSEAGGPWKSFDDIEMVSFLDDVKKALECAPDVVWISPVETLWEAVDAMLDRVEGRV